MSETDDTLREMAANRDCRLQKSRRRKPGGDFGLYGLKDAETGKEVFGFGPKGLTATAEEIESYLRGGAAAGWKGSLAGKAPKKKTAKPGKSKSSGAATAESKLVIREARPREAEEIAALIAALAYDVSAADIRRRLAKARKRGEPTLVAEQEGIVGCASWHVTPVLHRSRPVGRITMLTVAEGFRGRGIGTELVRNVEKHLRREGCGLVEITSNVKRTRAHQFYERLGFERTSYRFAKEFGD